MSIELLATQGRTRVHGGLASVEAARLRQMRNSALRCCFARMEETRYRMEHVAHIHGIEFINDAASGSVNATWYTIENTSGAIIWIALGDDNNTDYSRLRPLALRKVRMLICVGNDNTNLHSSFSGVIPNIIDVKTIADAVQAACYSGIDQAKVLFSPATPSLRSAQTLGQEYSHQVNEL